MNPSPPNPMQAFARGERELAVPAVLPIRRGAATGVLDATAVLRLLPRKRLVLRARLDGREVAVKWFAAAAHGRRHIERERAGLTAVQAAGVPAPDLLEQIATPDGRYLGAVYAWIDGAPELSRLWPALAPEQKRSRLRQLLDLLARMHLAGAYQADIHLGNFLVRDDTLWLLDLGTVATGRAALGRRASLANLAALAAQLAPADRPLLEALIPDYLRMRGWGGLPRALAIYRAALAQAWRARTRDYLEKAWRDCSLTRFAQDFSRLCAVRRQYAGEALERFRENPETLMARGGVLKAGNTATVARAALADLPVVIKRYNIKHWRHALSRCWRPSRAAHSWTFAHRLEIAGIPTPQPVALWERRWGWLRGRAYFVCAAVRGDDLLSLGRRGALPPAVLESLRRLLTGLMRERLSHGDFKATNFLVSDGEVVVIDLDAMRRHRCERSFRRAFARDLRRLQRNWDAGAPVRSQIDALVGELLGQDSSERRS